MFDGHFLSYEFLILRTCDADKWIWIRFLHEWSHHQCFIVNYLFYLLQIYLKDRKKIIFNHFDDYYNGLLILLDFLTQEVDLYSKLCLSWGCIVANFGIHYAILCFFILPNSLRLLYIGVSCSNSFFGNWSYESNWKH
jgi:hypothetical protein